LTHPGHGPPKPAAGAAADGGGPDAGATAAKAANAPKEEEH